MAPKRRPLLKVPQHACIGADVTGGCAPAPQVLEVMWDERHALCLTPQAFNNINRKVSPQAAGWHATHDGVGFRLAWDMGWLGS